MDRANDGRTRTAAADAATGAAKRPAGWRGLGLAALLGVVAGTVLFPTPARGSESRGRESKGGKGPAPAP